MNPILRRTLWTTAGLGWIGAAAIGLGMLMNYDNSPGPAAVAPTDWPADTRLARNPAGATLVMMAHPLCDCTRASIGELAELMARVQNRPRAYVVFIHPGGMPDAWEKAELWDVASAIPGVSVLRDDSGVEARRFGAQTSGQTLLYDAEGRLIFSGGTTGARGKPGDNAGRASLAALLDGGRAAIPQSPVFGCLLFGPADGPKQAELDNGTKSD